MTDAKDDSILWTLSLISSNSPPPQKKKKKKITIKQKYMQEELNHLVLTFRRLKCGWIVDAGDSVDWLEWDL